MFTAADNDPAAQISAVRSFISQGVDLIVFSPIVEDGWDDVLQEAKDADIPVILEDRTVTSSDDLYATWVGLDFNHEGITAGEWAAEEFAEPTKMVVLEGTTGSAPANDRAEGFAKGIGRRPIETIDSQTGDFTRDGGKNVMEGFLQKYGVDGIDLVYAHNDDMGLGAIEAIEAAGGTPGEDIKIVTIDAVKDGMQALVDGKINFIVECYPLLGRAGCRPGEEGASPARTSTRRTSWRPELHPGAGDRGHRLAVRTDPAIPVTVNDVCSAGCLLPGGAALCSAKASDACRPTSTPRRSSRCATSPFVSPASARSTAWTSFPRRGARADGRERRRQVDADQGVDRCVLRSTGAPSRSPARSAVFGSTADAQQAGISTVYQEVNLCTNLTVAENMMLGREPRPPAASTGRRRHREAAAAPREPRPPPRHPLTAGEPLDRRPAAGGHQPGDGGRRPGPGAGRADLQPGRQRGRPNCSR